MNDADRLVLNALADCEQSEGEIRVSTGLAKWELRPALRRLYDLGLIQSQVEQTETFWRLA
jgi:transcription initiation factor IIE alpha subunit